MRSEGRKPPIHMKQRSAGDFQIPERRWKTSVLATMDLRLTISLQCARKLSTYILSSFSDICSCKAAWSSLITRLCSSNHLAYSTSNIAASENNQAKPNQINCNPRSKYTRALYTHTWGKPRNSTPTAAGNNLIGKSSSANDDTLSSCSLELLF